MSSCSGPRHPEDVRNQSPTFYFTPSTSHQGAYFMLLPTSMHHLGHYLLFQTVHQTILLGCIRQMMMGAIVHCLPSNMGQWTIVWWPVGTDGCNVPQRLRIQSSWGLRHTSPVGGRNWMLAATFQHSISGWFSSGHSGFHPTFLFEKGF